MGEATRRSRPRRRPSALLLAAALALAACGSFTESARRRCCAGRAGGAPACQRSQPDSRGVITYATYQVAVARDGDTLATRGDPASAPRPPSSPAATRCPNYMLRAGEVCSCPTASRAGRRPRHRRRDTQPLGGATAAPARRRRPADNPFQNGQTDPLIDPVRHRVEAGETAYSIARLYGVSVTALASWNGLGPDLAVRENQELLIPIVSDANPSPPAPPTPSRARARRSTPPPSAAAPLPADIAAAVEPESPDLGAVPHPARRPARRAGLRLVTRPYNPANPNGIGFDVPAGTPVHAAAPGEVALVSEALGGLGTIVLVRHRDDLITTYSTLANVASSEGDRVQTGQVLGMVAPRDKPELQFDVFRGTTSVDPTPYLGG